ncbi:unnamed protein product [Ixodes pacificus]
MTRKKMILPTFIVVAVLACNFGATDATFDFGSPFYWLRDNPVDRTANVNVTLNATTMTSETTIAATTTIATTLASTTVATTEASTTEASTTSATTTMATSNTTFGTTAATTTVVDLLATAPPANYSSNYSTVNLDELALAIGHLQDPVLKLVTEADGTANFVVFDGRQGASETVSTSTITQDLTTVTSEAAPTSTTALPTSLFTTPGSLGAVSAPPPSFPGLLAFLRPYIPGLRAPLVPTTQTPSTLSTLSQSTPVAFRESDGPPSEASTTITVEPRSVPVTTRPLQTPPAERSPHPSATAATVAATSGTDLVTQSATVGTVITETTTRPVPALAVLSATIVTMVEGLPTRTTPFPKKPSTLSITAQATNTTYADNTKFPDVTADFKTTTGPPFSTRSATHGEGRVTAQFKVTGPTSFVVASSTVPPATHHGVIKITEASTDAANVTQPPRLPGLPSSLDGLQEDGTMRPLAEAGSQYRHYYDPSKIMRSVR